MRLDDLRWPPAVCAALPAALAAAGLVNAQERTDDRSPALAYTIECPEDSPTEDGCAADLATYIGWRVFGRYCAGCHGDDAEGSTFAPSLVHRLQRFDRRAFERALDEGYAGPDSSMKPWGEHPQVARYYAELWAYLSARRDGGVPPVPLRPLRERPADGANDRTSGR